MSVGVLNVTILKAIGLRDLDIIGRTDPYIVVKVGNEEKQQTLTSFVANVNQNNEAIWDERLAFKIGEDDTIKNIRFTVYDKDKFGSDDVVFTVERYLQADRFELGSERLELYQLGTSAGTLHIVVHYIPSTMFQKMYEKLNNYAETMKEKLISQLVTFVSEKIL